MKKPNQNYLGLKKREVLTREELKHILGGNDPVTGEIGGELGTCTVKVICKKAAEIECSGSKGACKYENVNAWGFGGWVQCDTDPKIECQ